MRIAVVTSLFPVPARPREGVFAERRWTGMVARGHEVCLFHPIPWAPPAPLDLLLGSERAGLARAPARQDCGGIDVRRPRYLHLPGQAASNAKRFARSTVSAINAVSALNTSSAINASSALDASEAEHSNKPFDVIVCDYAWPAAMITQELAGQATPIVIHGRGSDVLLVREDPKLAKLLADSLRIARHWCAVSSDLVEAMDSLAKCPKHGMLTPNGVDPELFQLGSKAAARAEVMPTIKADDGRLILVVGHLIERKRPLLALRTFAAVAAANDRLVFIGRGPLAKAIEDEARAAGLSDQVQRVGELAPQQLAKWYQAADLLLLTSLAEGRPNVVLEAMASGLPVVATDAGGTRELLQGSPSLLVEDSSVASLASATTTLLSSPPAPQACRDAAAAFTWPAALEALETALQQACMEA